MNLKVVSLRLSEEIYEMLETEKGDKSISDFLRIMIETQLKKKEESDNEYLKKIEMIYANFDFLTERIRDIEIIRDLQKMILETLQKIAESQSGGVSELEKKAIAEILYLSNSYGTGNWKALSSEAQNFLIENTKRGG